jgi:hypothetical protein
MKYSHSALFWGYAVAGILFLFAPLAYAQESQVLSVTPPLFQISALPGDVWQSSIKVVNGNPYPMTVFAEVVNFKASGEEGQGKFIPILDGGVDEKTLAEWIEIPSGPYTIPPERTKEIPFFIEIPKDAPPGGHYAAVLITTKEPESGTGQLAVKTSQAVTSLLFARIEGDVKELGSIREFRTLDVFVPRPEVEFSLRFENKGNVHLQPRGDILITNMWGTERGTIPVNYQTHFGNVLPESIRDFKFKWQSDLTFTDVGRYKAIVTLGYGEDGVKSASSVTYFWVVPVKITLITLSVIVFFILLIVWMVKAYVRRMLLLAGVSVDAPARGREVPAEITYRKVAAPIRSGVLDLRQRLDTVDESVGVMKTVWSFVSQYKTFFVSVFLLVAIFVISVLYIGRATEPNENYRVIIDEGDTETTLSGEDIERTGGGE